MIMYDWHFIFMVLIIIVFFCLQLVTVALNIGVGSFDSLTELQGLPQLLNVDNYIEVFLFYFIT